MSCGGEICRTGSGAVAAAEQRESVRVVVDIVCGGGESDQARTSTSTRTDDAAVKTETKVWGCLVAAKLPGLVQRRRRQSKGGAAAAERIAQDFVRHCRWMGFSFQVVVAVV